MSSTTVSYQSSVIFVGSVPLGGDYPVRIQSMTNTNTLDTKASVAQCIKIIEAGADFVRLTAPGLKEAENLAIIKKEIRKAGFDTPLIADIHFNPAVAELAASIVEKIRINPGNYADKRASFKQVTLNLQEYEEELERIHSRLLPLINICRKNKTVIRIGVNHGSLSDRIMSRYGNTVTGMTVSAMEFIRIFKSENFNNLVLSMKSSDIDIMVESTRELIRMMVSDGFSFPVHLGVTEAGEGEDGRIKSAAGIGALLSEGVGDTIRVSLTEDPEIEIPFAKKLVEYTPRGIKSFNLPGSVSSEMPSKKPDELSSIKGPLVIANMSNYVTLNPEAYRNAGYLTEKKTGQILKSDESADMIISSYCPEYIPEQVRLVVPFKIWLANRNLEHLYPLFSPETYTETRIKSEKLNIVLTGSHFNIEAIKKLDPEKCLLVFTFIVEKERFAPQVLLKSLEKNKLRLNVILNPVFTEDEIEDIQLKAASLLGRYLINRQIAGIAITNRGSVGLSEVNKLCFSILQCTGKRITRTSYISCPTCGRTSFDLQDAVKKVKEKTSHLKGIKIAVMGCVVNGPGEMAGADWGYVGAAQGKVHIYKGMKPVLKNVPEGIAVNELLRLIEEDQANR